MVNSEHLGKNPNIFNVIKKHKKAAINLRGVKTPMVQYVAGVAKCAGRVIVEKYDKLSREYEGL